MPPPVVAAVLKAVAVSAQIVFLCRRIKFVIDKRPRLGPVAVPSSGLLKHAERTVPRPRRMVLRKSIAQNERDALIKAQRL